MAVGVAYEQQVRWRDGGIVAKDPRGCVEQHALAVAALPPAEEQDVSRDGAEQAVTERPLDEWHEFGIMAKDALEEGVPDQCRRSWRRGRNSGDLGHVLVWARVSQLSRAKIDGAGRRPEEVGVAIPLRDGRHQLLIATGQADDVGDHGRSAQALGDLLGLLDVQIDSAFMGCRRISKSARARR